MADKVRSPFEDGVAPTKVPSRNPAAERQAGDVNIFRGRKTGYLGKEPMHKHGLRPFDDFVVGTDKFPHDSDA